jgi:hypothetical protein
MKTSSLIHTAIGAGMVAVFALSIVARTYATPVLSNTTAAKSATTNQIEDLVLRLQAHRFAFPSNCASLSLMAPSRLSRAMRSCSSLARRMRYSNCSARSGNLAGRSF